MKIPTILVTIGILLTAIFSAGCVDDLIPSADGERADIQITSGEWIVQTINVRLEWTVTQTSSMIDGDINRTAVANIKFYPTSTDAVNDKNSDNMPDLSIVTDSIASVHAKVSGPNSQFGQKFIAGSVLSRPAANLEWSSLMDGSYLSGDSITLGSTKTIGDGKRLYAEPLNYLNKIQAQGWIVFPPIRACAILKNPIDDTTLYDSGDITLSPIPVYLPFDPELAVGQSVTESYTRDFKLKIFTPFSIVGKFFYDIALQGNELDTHRTQVTYKGHLDDDLTNLFAWAFVGFTLAALFINPIFIIGAITVAAIYLIASYSIPDNVGKVTNWGKIVTSIDAEHWLYGGVAR